MGQSKSTLQTQESITNLDESLNALDGDPRSPSIDIDRTPVQSQTTSRTKPVTKNVDLAKECFDKFDGAILNPAIRALMNQIDPRSPTLDFQRTPLAFMMKNPETMIAYNNLNTSNFLNDNEILNDSLNTSNTGVVNCIEPKNLCADFSNISISTDDALASQEVLNDISDEESGNDSKCHETAKIDEPGLLETNFDYLETDLDTVRRYKSVKTKEEPILEDNPSVEVKSEDVEPIPLSAILKNDLSENDPRSPTIGIDRTPIVITDTVKSRKSNKKVNEQLKEVFIHNAKLQQKCNENARKNSKDLLIYEDDTDGTEYAINVNTKMSSNIQHNEGSRTPLACMNIEKTYSGSLHNTPVDNVKTIQQSKLVNSKSKIPVRVSKGITQEEVTDINDVETDFHIKKCIKSHRIISTGMENTPPNIRKACWDKDNSVLL